MILKKSFYLDNALNLAKSLLGKVLVREVDGKVLKAKIVETEAYIGAVDKASHAYNRKRTERTETLYHQGGVAYVYLIYGIYNCFNVVTNEDNIAEGVLIRALEPLNELDYISNKRFQKDYSNLKKEQIKSLTNGPGKLCMAYSIDRNLNSMKLYNKGEIYIEDGDEDEIQIVESKRIGIDYAEEAKDFLWRFYIKGNTYVSKI